MFGVRFEKPIGGSYSDSNDVESEAERAVQRLYDEFSGNYDLGFEKPDVDSVGCMDPASGGVTCGRRGADQGYDSEVNVIELHSECRSWFRDEIWVHIGGFLYHAVEQESNSSPDESLGDFMDISERLYQDETSRFGDNFVKKTYGCNIEIKVSGLSVSDTNTHF